jgi:DNA-binding CsgD family transcriptional regulator/tetratricopeptide (TPR) repeat protein
MRSAAAVPESIRRRGVTPREVDAWAAVARRLSNREIAELLGISVRTVESHIASLRIKLGSVTRAELRQAWSELNRGTPSRQGVRTDPLPWGLKSHTINGEIVGRAAPLRLLSELWGAAQCGPARSLVVSGEAGAGKNRLVAEFAMTIDGAAVLYGCCDEARDALFQPFTEILSAQLGAHSLEELAELVGAEGADALTRLVPTRLKIRSGAPEVREASPIASGGRRTLEAIVSYLAGLVRSRPTLLVLDDLHWAEPGGIAVLRQLLRAVRDAPLLTVMALRPADVEESGPLASLLADLRRDPTSVHHDLAALAPPDVQCIADAMGYSGSASEVHRRTQGNAYFVKELIRSLADYGEDAQLPSGVQATVLHRMSKLPLDTRNLVAALAVAGPRATFSLLGRVRRRAARRLLDDLEPADRAGLVRVVADNPEAIEFVHSLAYETVLASLPTGTRIRLHLTVASALLQGQAEDPRHIAEIARHLLAAGPLADKPQTLRYLTLAGENASAVLAFEEAAAWYERALGVLAGDPISDPTTEYELRAARAVALYRCGDHRFQSESLHAAELAVELGDPARVLKVLLARTPSGFTSDWGRSDLRLLGLIDWALSRIDDAEVGRRAELLAIKATELTLSDPVHARLASAQALTLARRAVGSETLGRVLQRHYWATFDVDDTDSRGTIAREIVELGGDRPDPEQEAYGRVLSTDVDMEAGDVAGAERHIARAELLVERLGQPYLSWIVASKRVGILAVRGELVAADALAEECLARTPPEFRAGPRIMNLAHACVVRSWQGHHGVAVAAARALVDLRPSLTSRSWLARALCEAGEAAEAADVFDRVAQSPFTDIPRNMLWRAAVHALSTTAVSLGDRERAAELHLLLEASSGRLDWFGGGSTGASDVCLGELAGLLGNVSLADHHFGRALTLCRRAGSRVALAQALLARALLLKRTRRMDEASTHAAQALAVAASASAGDVGRRAQQLLDELAEVAGVSAASIRASPASR